MRVRSFLMAGLVAVSLAANAGATSSLYFTATSGGVATQGVPGGVLGLQPGGGPWTIEMRISTDTELQTWGLNLTSASAGLSASNAVANTAVWPGAEPGVAGAGAALLVGAGFIDFNTTFAPAGDHLLLSFTLAGGSAGATVTGIVNENEIYTAAGSAETVRFADGPFVQGNFETTTGTLIQIVPEPATLGLLLIGGFALSRRRRSC